VPLGRPESVTVPNSLFPSLQINEFDQPKSARVNSPTKYCSLLILLLMRADETTMDVFVARQPIFDRASQLYAYELLFRSGDVHNHCDATDSASATTQVIANSLLTIGLENVVCGKKAFINFDHGLLAGGVHSMLPPETVVLEILETVDPTDDLIAMCQELNQQGYTLALDDFVGLPRIEPLTHIAKLIKVDMLATTKAEQQRILQTYRPRGIAMVAEKVETQAEFEWARDAGYDYFQGYFFARPAVLKGNQIPAAKINCLRLLRELQYEDLDFDRLRTIISEDLSFSYKLLRYVNSALFAGYEETQSISYALARLGEEAIRHWAALAALPVLAKDKPGELVTHSLVRARFSEQLAKLANIPETGRGFLMGLFSLLDALIDVPLQEALHQAGVASAITAALLGTASKDDPLRKIYMLLCQYEAGDWEAVSASAAKLKIKSSDISQAYSDSTLWAQQALHPSVRKANARRKTRHTMQGALQVSWEDTVGRQKLATVQVLNASATGLQLQFSEKVPVQTAVSCNDPKLGISGKGVVRYCNPSNGKFLVGLEFTNGTGWREPA
jgi:c-di-GMP-related signal transduction protein